MIPTIRRKSQLDEDPTQSLTYIWRFSASPVVSFDSKNNFLVAETLHVFLFLKNWMFFFVVALTLDTSRNSSHVKQLQMPWTLYMIFHWSVILRVGSRIEAAEILYPQQTKTTWRVNKHTNSLLGSKQKILQQSDTWPWFVPGESTNRISFSQTPRVSTLEGSEVSNDHITSNMCLVYWCENSLGTA